MCLSQVESCPLPTNTRDTILLIMGDLIIEFLQVERLFLGKSWKNHNELRRTDLTLCGTLSRIVVLTDDDNVYVIIVYIIVHRQSFLSPSIQYKHTHYSTEHLWMKEKYSPTHKKKITLFVSHHHHPSYQLIFGQKFSRINEWEWMGE